MEIFYLLKKHNCIEDFCTHLYLSLVTQFSKCLDIINNSPSPEKHRGQLNFFGAAYLIFLPPSVESFEQELNSVKPCNGLSQLPSWFTQLDMMAKGCSEMFMMAERARTIFYFHYI